MGKINKFLILTLCLSFHVHSSVHGKKLVEKLKTELTEHQQKMTSLQASIKTIENDIGKKNNNYLQKLEQMKRLQTLKEEMKNELLFNNQLADNELIRIQQILGKLLGSSLTENFNQVSERAILKDIINQRVEQLNSYKNNNKQIMSELDRLESKIIEVQDLEQEVYSVIQNLENKKNNLAFEYQKEMEVKDQIEKDITKTSFDEIEAKKLIQARKTNFEPPIEKFSNYRMERKGITFFLSKDEPIVASQSGKVSYVGNLASYGNVIMLEHQGNIRTVLLGNLNTNLKKGDEVLSGQKIGLAKFTSKKEGVYFEIRKQNNPLKVLSYLNLKKSNLISI